MRKRLQALLIIALSIMIAVFLSACGGDGTGGRIIGGGDGGSTGGGGIQPGDEGTLQWSLALGEINSCPAIGTIYVGSSNGYVYAVNHDGTLKWSYETGGAIDGAPAVGSDGIIYVGSVDRQIYALYPDGTLKWVYPTTSNFYSSPAIGSDGTIYIAGKNQDRIVHTCFDPSVEGTIEDCEENGEGEDDEEKGECPLKTFTDTISNMYALTPDGILKWQIVLSGEVYSSPAIALDGTIYIGTTGDNDDLSFDRFGFSDICDTSSNIPPSDVDDWWPVNGHLYAINPINGAITWDFRALGDVDSSPAIGSDGTIYVGSDAYIFGYGTDRSKFATYSPSTEGYMYAISPNGSLIWIFDAFGDVDSSPAIGSDGTIYFGSDKNDVFALNPNGTLKWVYPTRDDVDSSPAIASDGTIYIGSDDENLYALNPDGTLKWFYETGGDVDSSPTIWSNGTIYVGSDDANLYAINGIGDLADTPWPKFSHDLMNTGRSN